MKTISNGRERGGEAVSSRSFDLNDPCIDQDSQLILDECLNTGAAFILDDLVSHSSFDEGSKDRKIGFIHPSLRCSIFLTGHAFVLIFSAGLLTNVFIEN